jgi:hypothetical protein
MNENDPNPHDPNLKRGLVSVHQRRETGEWTHSRAGYPMPATWPTIAEATNAAVQWIATNPQFTVLGVTGHADKHVLRAAGIKFVHSRGAKRQSKSCVEAQSKIRDLFNDTKSGKLPLGDFVRRAKEIFGSKTGEEVRDRETRSLPEGGEEEKRQRTPCGAAISAVQDASRDAKPLSQAKIKALAAARAKRKIGRGKDGAGGISQRGTFPR